MPLESGLVSRIQILLRSQETRLLTQLWGTHSFLLGKQIHLCPQVMWTPLPNLGVATNSDWESGKIPTNEEELKKLFSYRNPLYNKSSAPPPKVSDPIPPIPLKEQKAGGEGSKGGDPSGSGGVPPSRADNTPMDHSQGDPSLEKVPEQEASSQKEAKPTRNILRPSRLPRRELKYTDDKCTILDPEGHPIGSLRLTDVVKSKKGLTSGAAKHREPDTPDLGSGGASAPVRK